MYKSWGAEGGEGIMTQIKMGGKQGTAVSIMRSSAVIIIGRAVCESVQESKSLQEAQGNMFFPAFLFFKVI